MAYEAKGKLEVISETNQVTDKFKKREFVLVVEEGMYPEYIKFQLTQDRCSLLDNYKVGDMVSVSFNLRGRPYTRDGQTTYFTNLDAWRVQGADTPSQDAPPPVANSSSTAAAGSEGTGMTFSESDDDELPF